MLHPMAAQSPASIAPASMAPAQTPVTRTQPASCTSGTAGRTWRIVSADDPSGLPDSPPCTIRLHDLGPCKPDAGRRTLTAVTPAVKPAAASSNAAAPSVSKPDAARINSPKSGPMPTKPGRSVVAAASAAQRQSATVIAAPRPSVAMPTATPQLPGIPSCEAPSRPLRCVDAPRPAAAERAAAGSRSAREVSTRRRDADTGLARIIDVWPKLPESVRKALLAIAETGNKGHQEVP